MNFIFPFSESICGCVKYNPGKAFDVFCSYMYLFSTGPSYVMNNCLIVFVFWLGSFPPAYDVHIGTNFPMSPSKSTDVYAYAFTLSVLFVDAATVTCNASGCSMLSSAEPVVDNEEFS